MEIMSIKEFVCKRAAYDLRSTVIEPDGCDAFVEYLNDLLEAGEDDLIAAIHAYADEYREESEKERESACL